LASVERIVVKIDRTIPNPNLRSARNEAAIESQLWRPRRV
jgi:hypothetical protein